MSGSAEPNPLNSPQIVIHVERGQIQETFSSQSEIEVLLVDWNVDGASINHLSVVDVDIVGRESALIDLTRFPPQPIGTLFGSRVASAIETAEHAVF